MMGKTVVLHQYSAKALAVQAIINHTLNIGQNLDSTVRELQSKDLDPLVINWFRLKVALWIHVANKNE